ncbi:ATP-binding cassette domain-containing protein [Siccirubricoccus deserti]
MASNSLEVAGIDAGYGAVRVLEDVSLSVPAGETVVLLGTNGNGKTTLMRSIMGQVRPSAGSIRATIEGVTHDLIGRAPEEIVELGIALVPEGRRLFPRLTVEQNLRLGAYRQAARAMLPQNLALCYELFPASPSAAPSWSAA